MQIQQGQIPLSILLPSAANSAAGGRRQSAANALSYGTFPMLERGFSGVGTIFSLIAGEIHATRSLMRLVPVLAVPGLDHQRHRELAVRRTGAFHDPLDDACGFRDLALR